MFVIEIPAISSEPVRFPVRAVLAGVAVDPTSSAGSVALMATAADPTVGDFSSAAWDVDATVSPSAYSLLRTVPTATKGDYVAWAKVGAVIGRVAILRRT